MLPFLQLYIKRTTTMPTCTSSPCEAISASAYENVSLRLATSAIFAGIWVTRINLYMKETY